MFRNVASQKLIVFAFDRTTNAEKTGDAANITAYVSKDYGATTVLTDSSATELESTNAKGYYLFDLTQAETDAATLHFTAKSSTANITVIGSPAVVFTRPANADKLSIDSNGRVDVVKVAGTTQTAGDLAAMITAVDDFVDTEVSAIKAKTDNLPTDPADASDIAASFTTVNTKLDTIDDFLDTEIAAIKAKTDNLPVDPADASDIAASFTTVNTKLDTIDDFVDTEIATIISKIDVIDDFLDTEIAAIKAQTDQFQFDGASRVASNLGAINSDAGSAASLAKTTGAIGRGTVSTGSTTTSVTTSTFTPNGAVAGQFVNRIILFDKDTTTAALRGQVCAISASTNAANPTFTTSALTTAPVSGDTFSVI